MPNVVPAELGCVPNVVLAELGSEPKVVPVEPGCVPNVVLAELGSEPNVIPVETVSVPVVIVAGAEVVLDELVRRVDVVPVGTVAVSEVAIAVNGSVVNGTQSGVVVSVGEQVGFGVDSNVSVVIVGSGVNVGSMKGVTVLISVIPVLGVLLGVVVLIIVLVLGRFVVTVIVPSMRMIINRGPIKLNPNSRLCPITSPVPASYTIR